MINQQIVTIKIANVTTNVAIPANNVFVTSNSNVHIIATTNINIPVIIPSQSLNQS